MMIYLLDDEPDMLSLLRDMVEEVNLTAECYGEAKQFFEEVKKPETPALMVLDLNMPEMDGIEVMRRLAALSNPPALILISGHDVGVLHSAEKLGHAHNLNIIASLNKPIHLKKFQHLLQKYCSNLGTRQDLSPIIDDSALQPKDLLYALKNDQLELHYQPQINIETGNVIACEALIRWRHPKKGLILPEKFISMTERNGWMGLLTGWVIKEAVEQEQRWKSLGHNLPISINISAENITTLSLPEQISELLEAKKLNPTMLTLELTESALMGELVTSLDILTRLRLKGIGLSIDDFGTGYSSLSMLHKVPFSELKIDRSFVSSMLEDDEARAIVRTCIILGHELKMQVVAEGVETRAHLGLLRHMGCDIAQGYFYSKPVPAKDMNKIILGS